MEARFTLASLREMKRVSPVILALLLAYIAWFTGENVEYLKSSCIDNFDRELLAIGTEAARSGDALTGAYSRLGFRHPGPFLFYYLAAFDGALPASFSANGVYRLGALVLNLTAVLISSLALARTLKLPVLGLLLFPSLLLSVPSEVPYLADYWNPRPVSSLFLLLIASVAASMKDKRWLPVAIFSFFACFHLHLGSLFGLIPIGALAVFLLVKSEGLRIRITCAGIAAVFMLPILIDTIYGPSLGNAGAIISFSVKSGWSHTYREVYEVLGSYFRTVLPFLPRFFAIVIILALAWGGAEKLGPEGKKLFAIVLSVLPFVAIGAYRVYGPLHQYLLSFAHGTIAILTALSLSFLVWLGAKLLKQSALEIGAIVAIAVVAFNLPYSIHSKECASAINVPKYIDALNPSSAEVYKLNVGELESRFAPKIILGLIERGVNVCVDRQVSYIFGEGMVCNDEGTFRDLWLLPKGAKKPEKSTMSFEGTRSVLWW